MSSHKHFLFSKFVPMSESQVYLNSHNECSRTKNGSLIFNLQFIMVFCAILASCTKVEEYDNTPTGNFEALWSIQNYRQGIECFLGVLKARRADLSKFLF